MEIEQSAIPHEPSGSWRLRNKSGMRLLPSGSWRLKIIAVLRDVEPLTGFLERSIFASGGLKPWLRSGKPYGLDQSRSLRHMARITDTPAPQGLPCAQGGL